MLNSSSIGKKLFIAFFLLTSLSAGIGYLSFNNIQKNSVVFNEIILRSTPRIQALLEMKNVSNKIGYDATLIQTIHTHQEGENSTSTQATESIFAADSKSLILADLDYLLRWISEYKLVSQDEIPPERKAFLLATNQSKSAIIAATLDYVDAHERHDNVLSIENKETILNGEITILKEHIENALLSETEELRIKKKNADVGMQSTLVTTMIMSGVSVVLAILAWLLLVRIIVHPLRALRDATHAVAGGNMEKIIPAFTNDEIGDLAKAFNHMIQQLRASQGVMLASNDELEGYKKELEKKLSETERMNKHMVDREIKMIELKKENAELKAKAGLQG